MKTVRVFFGYFILILIALSMLLPFFVMISLSFAHSSEIFSYPPKIFSLPFTFENYKDVFDSIPSRWQKSILKGLGDLEDKDIVSVLTGNL